MKLSRTFALTDIVLRAHILNPLWRSRDARRAHRCNVAAVAIPRYLKRYVPAPGSVPETPAEKPKGREKIFTIWFQGEENAPALVKACWRSVRKNCTDQDLVVLDEKTLWDYISLPDVIMEKRRRGQITNAHFADICRVELLYQHGGFWLDSTGFATGPIPGWIADTDFFVYMAGDNVGSPYSFIQNCFIHARRGAYLIGAWRQTILNFWMAEPREFDYFMHQLMFKALVQNDKTAAKYFEKMPHVDQDPTHALWWDVRDKPFNQKQFDEITSGAFFQKLTYRGAENPIPGSFADVMINKMYK